MTLGDVRTCFGAAGFWRHLRLSILVESENTAWGYMYTHTYIYIHTPRQSQQERDGKTGLAASGAAGDGNFHRAQHPASHAPPTTKQGPNKAQLIKGYPELLCSFFLVGGGGVIWLGMVSGSMQGEAEQARGPTSNECAVAFQLSVTLASLGTSPSLLGG